MLDGCEPGPDADLGDGEDLENVVGEIFVKSGKALAAIRCGRWACSSVPCHFSRTECRTYAPVATGREVRYRDSHRAHH
jgi:hypothetical protein